MFVGRVVGAGVRRSSASDYAHEVHGVCRDLADAMLEEDSAALQRCLEALDAAESPRGADALDFLLETLGKDLHDLIRVLQGPR
jgi:hypothetical protein